MKQDGVISTTAAVLAMLPHELCGVVLAYLVDPNSLGWNMDGAAANGCLVDLKVLHMYDSHPICTVNAMDQAASNGHVDVVQWLHTNRREGCTHVAFHGAAMHGHLSVLQYLLDVTVDCNDKRSSLEEGALYYAIQYGQLALVQWLLMERQCEPMYNLFHHACRCGHLSIVQYLHQHHQRLTQDCTTYAMDYAADNGHLDVVQWLHTHRTEGCTTNAMDFAAAKGHLHVLQWLFQHRHEGCTRQALFNAIANGQNHVVQWMLTHKKRPVVDRSVETVVQAIEYATYYEQPAIMQHLVQFTKVPISDL